MTSQILFNSIQLVSKLMFWMTISLGVVTAEMFQSKEDSDVMSKMVEDLDEVWSLLILLGYMTYSMYVLFNDK